MIATAAFGCLILWLLEPAREEVDLRELLEEFAFALSRPNDYRLWYYHDVFPLLCEAERDGRTTVDEVVVGRYREEFLGWCEKRVDTAR